jgi:small-conductance mechanosensitive channel
LLVSASALVNTLGTNVRDAIQAVRSLPLLWGWIEVMATSPIAREFMIDMTWRVLLALGFAIGVQWTIRYFLRGPVRRMEEAGWPAPPALVTAPDPERRGTPDDATARAEAGHIEPPFVHRRGSAVLASLRRIPRLLARLGLELLPVLATVLCGYLFAGSVLGGQASARLIILATINAYAVCTAVLGIGRVLLLPSYSRFALLTTSPGASRRLMLWYRRLVVGAIVAYAFGEVGYLLGMSPVAHAALQKGIGLYIVVILGIVAIQNRRPVRVLLAGREDATGTFATLRKQAARVWHWAACLTLASGWVIWSLEQRDGAGSFLRMIILTVFVVTIGRFVRLALHGVLEKALAAAEKDENDFGALAGRLRLYHRPLHRGLSVAVYALMILILLQIYGLGGLNWLLTEPLGRRFLSAIATVLVTVVAAIVVWELVNGAIQRHLRRLERDAQANRAARLRTLLPLLRTTLIVTIAIISGLMVLSEIGVNIAPLLAGAGIIGIAVGFGSQRLVQDLITGVFLLLENAMQVGDVVRVGTLVGTVESLSVRTIRLRSEDGAVHVIPFSAVTTVTNMTREFSRTVIQVVVAADENYERVVGILRGVVTEMRTEPAWNGIILDDLEVLGLQELDNIAMSIRCRIRCTAFGRWSVGREFNRRMKVAFETENVRLATAVVR